MDFLRENSLYISLILGIVAGYPLVRNINHEFSSKTGIQVLLRCCVFTLISVISVMLFAAMENAIAGLKFSFGAVSTYGLYLVAPLLILALFRKERRSIFDAYAFYILPSMVLQRIRCLIAGCCYGRFIFSSNLRYPTREAEIVFYVIMVFVLKRKMKENKSGSLFPFIMICYGTFRFLCEFLRYSSTEFYLHLAHFWSIISIIIGLSVYSEFRIEK